MKITVDNVVNTPRIFFFFRKFVYRNFVYEYVKNLFTFSYPDAPLNTFQIVLHFCLFVYTRVVRSNDLILTKEENALKYIIISIVLWIYQPNGVQYVFKQSIYIYIYISTVTILEIQFQYNNTSRRVTISDEFKRNLVAVCTVFFFLPIIIIISRIRNYFKFKRVSRTNINLLCIDAFRLNCFFFFNYLFFKLLITIVFLFLLWPSTVDCLKYTRFHIK